AWSLAILVGKLFGSRGSRHAIVLFYGWLSGIRLRTRDRLATMGIPVNTKCELCGVAEESRDLLFFFVLSHESVMEGALSPVGLRRSRRGWARWWAWVTKVCRGSLPLPDVGPGVLELLFMRFGGRET
ncbi:hypothetical protein Dimus_035947, partial [Dionaea muscipula]